MFVVGQFYNTVEVVNCESLTTKAYEFTFGTESEAINDDSK